MINILTVDLLSQRAAITLWPLSQVTKIFEMLKTVQVVVLLNLANCFSQCIATHPKSGPKWSIYDLLDELGLKSFSGLLETTGFMYTLSANASGLWALVDIYTVVQELEHGKPCSLSRLLINTSNADAILNLNSNSLSCYKLKNLFALSALTILL